MNIFDHLEKIRVFTAVVETGKINEAAPLLNLTQPSVTRTIQKLEDVLGAQLLERSRSGVKLTPSGEVFYQSCLRVQKEIADSCHRLHHPREVMAGQLTIGTYESLAEYLWPDFLAKMSELHPHLNLCIRTYSPSGHLTDFNSGLIDLLVDSEPRIIGDVVSYPLYADHFNIFGAPQLKLKNLTSESTKPLALLYVSSAFDEKNITIEDHLKKRNYRFSRRYAFDSFATVKRLAIRGLGIAVLPQRLADEDVRAKHLVNIHLEGFSRGGFGPHKIYASFKESAKGDARIKAVFRLLKDHLR